MASLMNNMDRAWSYIGKEWKTGFTLQPREIRVLNADEAKAIKSNKGVQRMLDSGLLTLNPSKDPIMVDTVAQTMKRGKKNLEEAIPIPDTNITVKTEIKGNSALEIPKES